MPCQCKGCEKQRRWQQRHPAEYAAKRRLENEARTRRNAAKPHHAGIFRVVELTAPDDPTLPRWVGVCRQGEHPWEMADLPKPLRAWIDELAAHGKKPVERVLLGSATPLTFKVAQELAKFRIRQISKMAGCLPGETADFLLVRRNALDRVLAKLRDIATADDLYDCRRKASR